ncbi:MAG: hypothetical protein ACM3N0_02665 [Chloroflexota bacterium]
MGGLRYANIGLAVSMVVLVGGVVILRNSDALGLVSLATFFTAFGVYHFLDERDKRRKGERTQRQ